MIKTVMSDLWVLKHGNQMLFSRRLCASWLARGYSDPSLQANFFQCWSKYHRTACFVNGMVLFIHALTLDLCALSFVYNDILNSKSRYFPVGHKHDLDTHLIVDF